MKTLLQAFRSKVFLSTSDPETARYASELCGKEDRTRIGYTLSETSNNANVGWLLGRTLTSKGSVAAVMQYQKQKEPIFEEKVFFDPQRILGARSVVGDGNVGIALRFPHSHRRDHGGQFQFAFP